MKKGVNILLILILALFVSAKIEVGNQAPEINLPSPSGENISLAKLKGNIVLVDFWASWCGPCRSISPELIELYEQYATNGFEIISISLDKNKVKWEKAIKDDNLPWKNHACDLRGWDSKVVLDYGVEALPNQFLVDRDGKIVAVDLTIDMLSDELENLLIKEAAVYPKKTSKKLFMNVYTRYEIFDKNGKKVKKGMGDEIDVSKLQKGEYNVIVGGKDHWFTKIEEKNVDVDFFPKRASTILTLTKAVQYEISNLKGEVVLKGSGSEIDISKLHIGVYYINFTGKVDKFLKK